MSKIKIQITGVSSELALGNYMPKDTTIFNNWEDFYHFNDLIHTSQLLVEYISEIKIMENEAVIYVGSIPTSQFRQQKSVIPVLLEKSLYLRAECAEQAVYQIEFETENFDKMKLFFETQDYDLLFKVGKSFLDEIVYEDQKFKPEWISGKSAGNICVLCRFENGFLVPIYDAIKKLSR